MVTCDLRDLKNLIHSPSRDSYYSLTWNTLFFKNNIVCNYRALKKNPKTIPTCSLDLRGREIVKSIFLIIILNRHVKYALSF